MQLRTIGNVPDKLQYKGYFQQKSNVDESITKLANNPPVLLKSVQSRLRSTKPSSFKVSDLLYRTQSNQNSIRSKCTTPISQNIQSPLHFTMTNRKLSQGNWSVAAIEDHNSNQNFSQMQNSKEQYKKEGMNDSKVRDINLKNSINSVNFTQSSNNFFSDGLTSSIINFNKGYIQNESSPRTMNSIFQGDFENCHHSENDQESIRESEMQTKIDQKVANPDEIQQQLIKQNLMIFNKKRQGDNCIYTSNNSITSQIQLEGKFSQLSRANLSSARPSSHQFSTQIKLQSSQMNNYQCNNQINKFQTQKSLQVESGLPQSFKGSFKGGDGNSPPHSVIGSEQLSQKQDRQGKINYFKDILNRKKQTPQILMSSAPYFYASNASNVKDDKFLAAKSDVSSEEMTISSSTSTNGILNGESKKIKIPSQISNQTNLEDPHSKMKQINTENKLPKNANEYGDDINKNSLQMHQNEIRKSNFNSFTNTKEVIDCREHISLLRIRGNSSKIDYSRKLLRTQDSISRRTPIQIQQPKQDIPQDISQASNKASLLLSTLEREKRKIGSFVNVLKNEGIKLKSSTTMATTVSTFPSSNKQLQCNQIDLVSSHQMSVHEQFLSKILSNERLALFERLKAGNSLNIPFYSQRDEIQYQQQYSQGGIQIQSSQGQQFYQSQDQEDRINNEGVMISPWQEGDQDEKIDDGSLDFIQYTTIS